MDAVLTALVGAAPQLGASGVLLVLLTLSIRRESQDRADYRAAIAETAIRHAEEMKRVLGAHNVEITGLHSEVTELREQLDEVHQRFDDERDRRRYAEDSVWKSGRHRQDPPPSEGSEGSTADG